MINADVIMQSNSALKKVKVVGRSMTPEGVIVGPYNENPKLNSIECDVELSDSQEKEHVANSIAALFRVAVF